MKFNHILYLDNTETIYTRAIKNELANHASAVDCFFYDEIYTPPIFEKRFSPSKSKQSMDMGISSFLNMLKKGKYDLILVKEPFYLPIDFFFELKKHFSSTPILNYNWSSVKKDNFLPYRELFDIIGSFDMVDCKEFDLKYLPLFYLKEFTDLSKRQLPKKYLMSFIGSGYSVGRIEFMERLVEKEKANLDRMFLYLFTPNTKMSLKLYMKHKTIAKYSYWEQLHLNGVLNIFSQSESTIDHPMTIQNGLTIRTFEALAAGIHLFTTNAKIKDEPFYSENRITVISPDLSNLNLKNIPVADDDSFMESFQQYRIDNWVTQLLNL